MMVEYSLFKETKAMNDLQLKLLETIHQESSGNPRVGVAKHQYLAVMDEFGGNWGESDVAIAMQNLCQEGYITNPITHVLGTVYLTELGLLASVFGGKAATLCT